MEQQQASVVFGGNEPKPSPMVWIKISYPAGYTGFKGWPEGAVKCYRKDAADLIIARGIAVETEAPSEDVHPSAGIDTSEETDSGVEGDGTEEDKSKNKTGKKSKK